MKTFLFRARRYFWRKDFQVPVAAALLVANVVILTAQAGNLLDTNFNPGSGPNGLITALALQTDGRILVVGAFTQFNATPRNRVARLNSDGSVDPSFNPGAGAD